MYPYMQSPKGIRVEGCEVRYTISGVHVNTAPTWVNVDMYISRSSPLGRRLHPRRPHAEFDRHEPDMSRDATTTTRPLGFVLRLHPLR